MTAVTISPKYQIVIPLELRRRLALEPGGRLMVIEFNGGLRLVPVEPAAALRGIARGIDTRVARDEDRPL